MILANKCDMERNGGHGFQTFGKRLSSHQELKLGRDGETTNSHGAQIDGRAAKQGMLCMFYAFLKGLKLPLLPTAGMPVRVPELLMP